MLYFCYIPMFCRPSYFLAKRMIIWQRFCCYWKHSIVVLHHSLRLSCLEETFQYSLLYWLQLGSFIPGHATGLWLVVSLQLILGCIVFQWCDSAYASTEFTSLFCRLHCTVHNLTILVLTCRIYFIDDEIHLFQFHQSPDIFVSYFVPICNFKPLSLNPVVCSFQLLCLHTT